MPQGCDRHPLSSRMPTLREIRPKIAVNSLKLYAYATVSCHYGCMSIEHSFCCGAPAQNIANWPASFASWRGAASFRDRAEASCSLRCRSMSGPPTSTARLGEKALRDRRHAERTSWLLVGLLVFVVLLGRSNADDMARTPARRARLPILNGRGTRHGSAAGQCWRRGNMAFCAARSDRGIRH
jgi:hypothetical protein